MWDDWSDGIGHPIDTPETKGVFGSTTVSLIGRKGELRPPPAGTAGSATFSANYQLRHGFEEADASGNPRLYLINNTSSAGRLTKVSLATATYLTSNNALDYSNPLGHPARYKGNWYFNELAATTRIRKLTTSANGVIGSDTIDDDGGSNYGNGHLFTLGHQLASVTLASGVKLLKSDDPPLTGTWGSVFPVGDPNDTSIGAASLQGLAYVLRGRGLYTFNDRGRAGPIYEDLAAWQGTTINTWNIASWKGGLVFTHPSGIYWWAPGQVPVSIGLNSKQLASGGVLLDQFQYKNMQYSAVVSIGDYIYVVAYRNGESHIYCGEAKDGDPTKVVWNILLGHTTSSADNGLCVVTRGQTSISGSTLTTNLVYQDGTTLNYLPLTVDGSPFTYDPTTNLLPLPTQADSWLPMLVFPEAMRITKVVLHTSDSTTNRTYKVRAIVNGAPVVDIGPASPASGRIPFSQIIPGVYSLFLQIVFASAAAGEPAIIRRIEVWGEPDV